MYIRSFDDYTILLDNIQEPIDFICLLKGLASIVYIYPYFILPPLCTVISVQER